MGKAPVFDRFDAAFISHPWHCHHTLAALMASPENLSAPDPALWPRLEAGSGPVRLLAVHHRNILGDGFRSHSGGTSLCVRIPLFVRIFTLHSPFPCKADPGFAGGDSPGRLWGLGAHRHCSICRECARPIIQTVLEFHPPTGGHPAHRILPPSPRSSTPVL